MVRLARESDAIVQHDWLKRSHEFAGRSIDLRQMLGRGICFGGQLDHVDAQYFALFDKWACCTWKRQEQSVAEVANETAKPKRPYHPREIKARAVRIHIEFIS